VSPDLIELIYLTLVHTIMGENFILSCRYVLSFSLGAGPVPALLLPEIFASRIRAKAVALSLGMHWVSDGSSTLYFQCHDI